jgi:hypothetical protein
MPLASTKLSMPFAIVDGFPNRRNYRQGATNEMHNHWHRPARISVRSNRSGAGRGAERGF